jgi:N-acetylneuraminate synthase
MHAWNSSASRSELAGKVTLLHCTTEYPAPRDQINLRAMTTLAHAFGLPCGYSDHTAGLSVSLAAVALGACVIEKHLTLDQNLPGPDHKASIEPSQLKALVDGVREIEDALGDGVKIPVAAEIPNMAIARKSLVAARPITKHQVLCESDLAIKRPGHGISPMEYWALLGTSVTRDYAPDDLILSANDT